MIKMTDIVLDVYLTPVVKIGGKTIIICDAFNGDWSYDGKYDTEFDQIKAKSEAELYTKLSVFNSWEVDFNKNTFKAENIHCSVVPKLTEMTLDDSEGMISDFCQEHNVSLEYLYNYTEYEVTGSFNEVDEEFKFTQGFDGQESIEAHLKNIDI